MYILNLNQSDQSTLTSMTSQNKSLVLLSVLYDECVQKRNQTTDIKSTLDTEDADFGAVMYITTVLVFYSAGIVVMIIKYLKTEKMEMEEDAALENFFKHMPDQQRQMEHHVNKVAIQAFHTLTSGSAQYASVECLVDEECVYPPQTLLVSDV